MPRKKPEFAKKIKKNIERWRDYWKFNTTQYSEFMSFVMGTQWSDDEERVFNKYNKIPLTFNKLAPLVNHLLGEQRQNTPDLQLIPDEDIDAETANIRQALLKDIALDSDAHVAYQIAFQSAVIGGFGAFRVATDYVDEDSFDQFIYIDPIQLPTRCFWDVGAKNPCKTDGMYAGFLTPVSRKKFSSMYGSRIERSIQNDDFSDGDVFNDDDSVMVIDYYERKYTPETLYLLSNGRIVNQQEFDFLQRETLEDETEVLIDGGMMVFVEKERVAHKYTVKHHKYAGDYELESSELSCSELPIIFVDQNSYWDKKGKQICRPFVKDAKDAQRYINYIGTQSAYLLKISRYDQYVASRENVRSPETEAIWRDPTNVQGALLYDKASDGSVPQRQAPPELSQSLTQQYERGLQDIQTSTGMYTAHLGRQGNEISGAAIDARTRQGNYNTYIIFDSLNRAISCAGGIINEIIPSIYDTTRSMSLNLPDRGVQNVFLNQPLDEYGSSIHHDMTKGKFKTHIKAGPGWEGQRQQALESMQMILQSNPQIFNLIADLYVENLPLKNNIELRNRLKTIVPPDIIEAGKTGQPMQPKGPDPAQQAAQVELQAKIKDIQLKEQKIQLDQQKLQMEAQKTGHEVAQRWQELENERLKAAASLQEMELRYAAETERTQSDVQIAHASNLVDILTHNPNK